VVRDLLLGITDVKSQCLGGAGGINSFAEMREWGTSSDEILVAAPSPLINAWLINIPQIVLSFCYIALNGICTSLASAQEWNNLAATRKGLRVTRPAGQQRSTYFLQLPHRWAMPLLVTSGTLHWLMSQSFFFVRFDVINREKFVVSAMSRSGCGFSRLSLMVFFVVALVLVGVIGYMGTRSLEQRLPFAASCSLVVSAACHPLESEVDPQLKKVKWRVVGRVVEGGHEHCSLTSTRAKKKSLVEGMVYL
jgi:hypothetical protein